MSRVKIKSKVMKATLENKDVISMFKGVLGEDDEGIDTHASLSIMHGKYLRLAEHVGRYLRVLDLLRGSSMLAFFPDAREDIEAGYDALVRQQAAAFRAPDLAAHLPPSNGMASAGPEEYALIEPNIAGEFIRAYRDLKTSPIISGIILTCRNLSAHKKSLEDADALLDRFMLKYAGSQFVPVSGMATNFRHLYIDDRLSAEQRQFILIVLHKLYTISHSVYEVMSTPDINVEEFIEVIINSIDEVRKHIPRCDAAFDKIVECTSLLRGNFSNYYQDFVATNNPTLIMESFVVDVSKQGTTSPGLANQFRRIISHYRKMHAQSGGGGGDQKFQSLFQQVDKNFDAMQAPMPDDEDDEPPAPAAAAPAPAALPPAAKPDDGWLSDFSDEEPGKKGKLPKKSKRKPGQRGAAAAKAPAATSVPGPSKSLADELRDD